MNRGNRAEIYTPGFSLVPPASGVVLLYLKNKTSAKIMENSRPRLYFAGEGACSTIYLLRELLVDERIFAEVSTLNFSV